MLKYLWMKCKSCHCVRALGQVNWNKQTVLSELLITPVVFCAHWQHVIKKNPKQKTFLQKSWKQTGIKLLRNHSQIQIRAYQTVIGNRLQWNSPLIPEKFDSAAKTNMSNLCDIASLEVILYRHRQERWPTVFINCRFRLELPNVSL